MSETSMYEAQKKKMEGLCNEHELTFRFQKDTYPLIFTIKPTGGIGAQMSMLENVEEVGYRSPDASMTWIFEDGNLQTKVTGGTFTISKTLRTKIENILVKMITYWQQYFFRDVIQRGALKDGMKPEIDESDADDTDIVSDGVDLPEGAEPLEDYVDDTEGEDLLDDETDELPDTEDDDPVSDGGEPQGGVTDEEIAQAISIIRMENKASVSLLQRRMNIGYAKAAKIIDALEEQGVVGPYNGSQPREVLPFDEPDEEVADNA